MIDFEKYNANPKQKKTGDCVIRALALALNKTWLDVNKDLFEISCKKCLILNDDKVFRTYLKQLGLEEQKMPKKPNGKRYTVGEFMEDLCDSDKTYIVRVANHLTCIKNLTLYDTWNCSNKCMGNYWIV